MKKEFFITLFCAVGMLMDNAVGILMCLSLVIASMLVLQSKS